LGVVFRQRCSDDAEADPYAELLKSSSSGNQPREISHLGAALQLTLSEIERA